MYYGGRWGTVCGRHFSYQDAIVVCKQLGFNYVVDIKTKAEFGEGNGPIWFHRVDCYGDEEELKYCGHLPWGTGDCWHDEDAGVICSGEVTFVSNNILKLFCQNKYKPV